MPPEELARALAAAGADTARLRLKPYQMMGVNWMDFMRRNRRNGILADEMGLGKTVQTVAFFALLSRLHAEGRLRPGSGAAVDRCGPGAGRRTAPNSSWWRPRRSSPALSRELAVWTPSFEVVVVHGPEKGSAETRRKVRMADAVVTTYSVFESQARGVAGGARKILCSVLFEVAVLDEGHCPKNPKSNRARRLAGVRARQRLLLTGTPVQNCLEELLALLSFLEPKVFDGPVRALFAEASKGRSAAPAARSRAAGCTLRRTARRPAAHRPAARAPAAGRPAARRATTACGAFSRRSCSAGGRMSSSGRSCPRRRRWSSCRCDRGAAAAVRGGPARRARTAPQRLDPRQQGRRRGRGDARRPRGRHLFTVLRKAANHPLLLRDRFADPAKLERVADALRRAGAFGPTASLARVLEEGEGAPTLP